MRISEDNSSGDQSRPCSGTATDPLAVRSVLFDTGVDGNAVHQSDDPNLSNVTNTASAKFTYRPSHVDGLASEYEGTAFGLMTWMQNLWW